MEVTVASTQAGEDARSIPKLDGVFSIEEFMGAEAEARHAALKAEKAAATGQKGAAPSNTKAVKIAPSAAPVALGSRSSKYTVDLHAKYQALGISQPMFTFNRSSDRGWSGEVSFPGLDADELQDIKDNTIYSSKQQVKEGLSKQALEILLRLEQQGRIKKVTTDARVRTSQYRVALHDKCQKGGLPQPHFEYTGSNDHGWSAEIMFHGLELDELNIKDETRFANKQEAREAVSKQALEALGVAETEGKLERFGKAKGPAQHAPKEKEGPGPNYTGMLLGTYINYVKPSRSKTDNVSAEYQRANGDPQPTYTDYQVGTLFTCQVTIESLKLDGTQTFGSLDTTRSSKKAARQEAARCAVEHFKSLGLWPDDALDVGGIKKKTKIQGSEVPELIPLTPTPNSHRPSITSTTPASPASASGSYPQRVARLAVTLSLGTPEWRYTPSAAPDFHTVACYFPIGGGAHGGPIGEVRNVLGKKKAKEECARLTLTYLEEVHRYRIECGMRMLEGIKGGEEVVSAALGKVAEGEAGVRMEVDGKEESDDDNDLEFEDAMEDLRA
jgi:hypothetical protein